MWLLLLALGVMALAAVPEQRISAALAAAFNVAFGIMLTVYVFGLDTYTNRGSRWSNRGHGAHTLYLLALAVATAFALFFAVMAARRARGWSVRLELVSTGALDLILGYLVLLAFDND